MTVNIISGKVLVVDDQMNEPIKNLIECMMKNGIHAQYWNSKGDFHKHITNVRVLILDLNLTSGQASRGTKFYYLDAIEVLHNIKGPYIVLIYATDFTEKDIDWIRKAYEDIYEEPFEGHIEGIDGLTKSSDPEKLIDKIIAIIRNKEVYRLIQTWEKLLDRSKDLGLQKFASKKFENEVRQFVGTISTEVGAESVPREFVSHMLRFVSRDMLRGEDYNDLKQMLDNIGKKQIQPTSDLLLQNRNMYFEPHSSEDIWTGDIFKIKNGDDYWDYGIILTPECDIAQDKLDNFLVCKGFALDQRIKETNHPIYSIIDGSRLLDQSSTTEAYKKAFVKQMARLRKCFNRYYALWNFSEKENKYIGLCFDFQRMCSINKDAFSDNHKSKRIARLDIPYVTELIQKYSTYSTRLGIPSINHPHINDTRMDLPSTVEKRSHVQEQDN